MRARRIAALLLRYSSECQQPFWWLEKLYLVILDFMFFVFFSMGTGLLMGNPLYGLTVMAATMVSRPTMIRGAINLGMRITDEISERTLVATFASPLTLAEFLAAGVISSLVNALVLVSIGYVIVVTLLGFNTRILTHAFLTMLPSLLFSGIVLGLFMITIAFGLGKRSLIWLQSLGWFLAGMSCVFYPLAALPDGFQVIARAIPMTYIFEGLRAQVLDGSSAWPFLVASFKLNAVYLVIALLAVYLTFKHAKNRGLASLEAQ